MDTHKWLNAHPAAVSLLGGLAITMASLQLRLKVYDEQRGLVTAIILIGLVVFTLGAASLKGRILPDKISAWLNTSLQRLGITATQAILIILAIIFAYLTILGQGENDLKMLDVPLSVTCWLTSMVLVVIGTWQLGEQLSRPSKKTLLIAGGLFLVSTVIRIVAAGEIPPLLNGDEASSGLSAVDFISGKMDNIFGVGWFSFPSLYYFMQSLSIRVWGQGTFALRFTSAIAGGLTVMAVFLIGQRMFSPRAGLLAAIFLMGSHMHNHFSRIGLNNIWDGLWFVLVLGMLWDGWQHKRRSSFIIAGFSLGMAQYFYVSSRFLLVMVPVWLAYTAFFKRKRWLANRANILYLFIVALVVMLPSIWFFTHDGDFYHLTAPFNRVEALGEWLEKEIEIVQMPAWKIMAKQLLISFKTFISVPLQVWYPAGVPILQPAAAAIFLAGMILLLFRFQSTQFTLMYMWIGGITLAGGLSVPASAAQRFVAAVPGCALMIGFGLDEIFNLVSIAWQNRPKLFNAIAILLIAWISLNDLNYYLFEYTPNSELGGLNTLVAGRLADYLQDKDHLQVAFFGAERMGYYSITSTAFLAPHIEGLDFHTPYDDPENPTITSRKVAFVFLPGQETNLALVKEDYPEGELVVEDDYRGEPLYWLYLTEAP